ncbi:hypothetical protein BDQ17DRAFT_1327939 [Cyathus striatus]|nr:hypothetical protein BDQ17DRAFT_1327939 [Cyathus striatus]
MTIKALTYISIVVFLANVIITSREIFQSLAQKSLVSESYNYVGHDVPEYLPHPHPLESILLQVEESNRYRAQGLQSDPEWFSLTTSSIGYVRLGDPKRMFMVTMFHEFHCLRMLNLAFEPTAKPGTPEYIPSDHLRHCLDYLRQMVLCSADMTLEEGDFTEREFDSDRLGAVHVCKDWSAVYGVMEENWREWTNSTRT